jgi:hypothetical protein
LAGNDTQPEDSHDVLRHHHRPFADGHLAALHAIAKQKTKSQGRRVSSMALIREAVENILKAAGPSTEAASAK